MSTAVMFAPGKILQVCGESSAAMIVDINRTTPLVQVVPAMSSHRIFTNAAVLAGGRVAVTGGSDLRSNFATSNVSYHVELFDPGTRTWTVGPNELKPRQYRSFSLLLPDATVLSAGGGAPNPVNNLDGQICYPLTCSQPTEAGPPDPLPTTPPFAPSPHRARPYPFARGSLHSRIRNPLCFAAIDIAA